MNDNTAKWVWDQDAIDFGIGAWACDKCYCVNHNLTYCGKSDNPMRWSGSKYCPNCGRKMVYNYDKV